MQIRSEALRKAYVSVKAAAVARTIRQVAKTTRMSGGSTPHPTQDNIRGIPNSPRNSDETDPQRPTQHLLPTDPEFNTDQIITGNGYGPSLERKRQYL
jgi:hypothetical protein